MRLLASCCRSGRAADYAAVFGRSLKLLMARPGHVQDGALGILLGPGEAAL